MSSPLRVAVTGPGGRLGKAILESLEDREDFVGLPLGRKELDLGEPEQVEKVLSEIDFDFLINTAATTDVDGCESEPDLARAVNALSPAAMARACAGSGRRLVQISTDYVFAGHEPGIRTEEDEASPSGVYAETKREGELLVLEADSTAAVARTSWLYGPQKPSFIDAIIKRAQTESEVAAVGDKTSVPSYSIDLALLVREFFRPEVKGGIYHLCNEGSCTWREFGQAAIRHLFENGFALNTCEVGSLQLSDLKNFVAPRPQHSAMSIEKFAAETGVRPRPWKTALQEYLDRYYLTEA